MNLFGELKELLVGEVAIKAANIIGEKEDKVKTAIEGLIPTVVGGLMKRATNETGATTLMNMVKKGKHDETIIEQLDSLLKNKESFVSFTEKGNNIVSMLLPDKKSSIATMISQFAGVRNSSATSLLAMVTPLVMDKLGKLVHHQGLDKVGLANTLLEQKSYLLDETPEALQPKMIDVLGLNTFMSEEIKPIQYATGSPIKSASITINKPVNNKSTELREVSYSDKDYNEDGGMKLPKWLLPAVLITVVLAGVGYFAATYNWSRFSSNSNTTLEPDTSKMEQVTNAQIDTTNLPKDTVAVAKVDSAISVNVPASKTMGISLPNGQKLDLPEGTFNYKFAKYLTDSSAKVNQTFTFDNLNFESNSPVLLAGSEKTVQDLAKIMTAYSRVQVKLTGYTDNKGDSLQNRRLSAKRALTVRNLLIANGISDIRIDFAGRGSLNPVASNATEAGKSQNRRIEVKVVRK